MADIETPDTPEEKNKGGRPLKFKTVGELQVAETPPDPSWQAYELAQRIALIQASGITKASVYTYRNYDDTFAMKLSGGTFRQMWTTLNSSPLPISLN